MVNWSGVVVPIVIVVLALAGTLIVALVNNYIQSLNKPIIGVIIEPNGRKALINLTNDGLAPATNLSLIIKAFKNFTQVTKKLGPADVMVPQLPKVNQTLSLTIPQNVTTPGSYLELRIPKLPHGEGSLTQIEITNGTSNGTYSDFEAAAIFDQGSSIGRKPLRGIEALDRDLSFFGGFYVFLIYYIFALGYASYYFAVFVNRKKNRRRFKQFISNIRDLMMDIHSSFEGNEKTEENIYNFIEAWKYKSALVYIQGLFKKIPEQKKRQIVVNYLDMKDYLIIENLYRKLASRLRNPNGEGKKNYNENCLKLVEDALKSIYWKKYI